MLDNTKSALFKIDLKDADIIGVSFSADGSNISLALSNGSIYFYQVCIFYFLVLLGIFLLNISFQYPFLIFHTY